MTEQEFSALFDSQDEALLGELGDSLRATPALELPADFARQTAQAAEQRFRRLPALSKLAVRLEPVLGSSVASRRAFPFAIALLVGTVLGGVMGQQAVADLGLGLMGLVLLWKVLSQTWLPRIGDSPTRVWPAQSGSFYLLPLASAVMTALVCGGGVSALGLFSINFKTASWNTVLLGPAAGLAVFLYLLSALWPSWKALQRHSVGRPRWIYPVQLMHAGLLGMLGSLVTTLYDPKVSLLWVWLPLLLLALIVSLTLGSRPTVEDEGRPALWRALSKSVRSLVIGGLPIGALLVGAYEATLTRQIEQPRLYESTLGDVRAWLKQQDAIPPQQNGWTELREAMTYTGDTPPALLAQLKAGGKLYEPESTPSYWQRPDAKVRWNQAREEFLKAVPTIRSVVSKPYFSHVSTQGYNFQSKLPNYIASRAGSQGLSALTTDAIRRGQTEEALDYQLTNLAWSTKMRPGSLISLMIGVAQEAIALDTVEAWLYQTHPSAEQLRRLLAGLQSADFDRLDLQNNMKREIYLADLAFTDLLEKNPDNFEGGWVIMLKILPTSYWRSEHKAYLNLMLANQDALSELGRPSDMDPSNLLPFSFAARQLAPMTHRAQAQFMVILTRFKALETVVALELYEREHGAYPDSLAALVPAYLPELPKNVASPNLWNRKPILDYQRKGGRYELVAQSAIFESVKKKGRQVFGPDGTYKLEDLPK
jgi:hypothetical protein